ncbi:MAG: type II secretion system minor pseudopilin GspH [Gammaproteobacteria bacterium]|nr:type II secretion system minor pseudopilin GspH [Gammaproteobacteria bacterium]
MFEMRNEYVTSTLRTLHSAFPTHSPLAFTLIEILVVIVIIGIAVGVIVLPFGSGGRERKMEEFSRQLTALLHFAHDQAIFESQELGLVFNLTDREYHFVRYGDDQTWKIITDEKAFKQRALTPDFQVEVTTDGEKIQLPTEGGEQKLEAEPPPSIVFFSSGEMIPFEMRVYSKEVPVEYKIIGEMNGELKLKRGDVEV